MFGARFESESSKKTKNKFAGNEKVRTFAIRASKNGAKKKEFIDKTERTSTSKYRNKSVTD